MASLNKVFLMGNLTRDPEIRYTPSGNAVTSFGLAINRNYTTQSGEKKEDTCFVRVVVFGRQAETCSKYLSKGRLILLEGRLQYRTWESEEKKRSSLDIIAERVQFLPTGRGRSVSKDTEEEEIFLDDYAEDEQEAENQNKNEDEEEVPF